MAFYVPRKQKVKGKVVRVYGQYLSKATENKDNCAACIVSLLHSRQCIRKRGFGPKGEFCAQHGKLVEKLNELERAARH